LTKIRQLFMKIIVIIMKYIEYDCKIYFLIKYKQYCIKFE